MSEEQRVDEQKRIEEQRKVDERATDVWQALRDLLKAEQNEHPQSTISEQLSESETVIRNANTGEWISFLFEPEIPLVLRTNRYPGNHGTTYLRFRRDPIDGNIKFFDHKRPSERQLLSAEDLVRECVNALAQRSST